MWPLADRRLAGIIRSSVGDDGRMEPPICSPLNRCRDPKLLVALAGLNVYVLRRGLVPTATPFSCQLCLIDTIVDEYGRPPIPYGECCFCVGISTRLIRQFAAMERYSGHLAKSRCFELCSP